MSDLIDGRQKKLGGVTRALEAYEAEKQPLEELLLECEKDELYMPPQFGFDLDKADQATEKIDVSFVSLLSY